MISNRVKLLSPMLTVLFSINVTTSNAETERHDLAIVNLTTESLESRSISKKLKNGYNRCEGGGQSKKIFEADIVRPLVYDTIKSKIYSINPATDCLEIVSTKGGRLTPLYSIPVGLSPVSLALANSNELWVVNQNSDSVSIVNVEKYPYITRTLLVGDEPRDIVFAGSDSKRAFITTAHRGQHHQTFDISDIRTPSIGRADVWVYDVDNIGEGLSGEPLNIINLFTDTPRALAVNIDKSTVYAAGYFSGNKTTTVFASDVDVEKPGVNTSIDGIRAPKTGLIVKHNGNHWIDEIGTIWDNEVNFELPDYDVFEIDAVAETPIITRKISSVGTTIFNLAVNPSDGTLFVSNFDARNEVRFEGSGDRGTTVRGKFVTSRITIIDGGQLKYVDLNPHTAQLLPIGEEYSQYEKSLSTSQPTQMLFDKNGENIFIASYGNAKVLKVALDNLNSGEYRPEEATHIQLPGGVSGIEIDHDENFLYAYSRFDNVISLVDISSGRTIDQLYLATNESPEVSAGREFFHDANIGSGTGNVSCGSCHIFGDYDALAWDLGNPDEHIRIKDVDLSPASLEPSNSDFFHPLKGPMTTQTIRGISDSGPMHWRGDRSGVPRDNNDTFEAAAFRKFNGAFVSLLSRGEVLNTEQLDLLTAYGLSILSPPNPIRNLDNSLNSRQAQARDDYFEAPLDQGISTCNSCHTLDPQARLFGTDKMLVNDGEIVSQDIKVPHLRNMYQKVGMFGTGFLDDIHVGEQVRGFGYIHDGSFASLDDFIKTFSVESEDQAFRMTEYILAFPNENAPIVGQQVTISSNRNRNSIKHARLLLSRFNKGECNLVYSFKEKHRSKKDRKNRVKDVATFRNLMRVSKVTPVTLTCMPVQS